MSTLRNTLFLAALIATLAGCASSRTYTQTVYSVDENGNVVATEVERTRPAPKPLKGGDTSCTICGF